MTALERRYRRLLRAYPARYRRDRGEEILGTLLEAAPEGRRWPSARDSRALITGGLRVRAAQNMRLGTRANLRLAALLGVALAVAYSIVGDLVGVNLALARLTPMSWLIWYLALLGLVTMAVVAAAWFARPAILAVIAVAAAIMSAVPWHGITTLPAPLLLIALAVLARGAQRPPRSWLWLVGGITFFPLLLDYGNWHGFPAVALAVWPWALLGVALLWIFIDARLLMAVAIFLALYAAEWLAASAGYRAQLPWQLWSVPLAAAAVLAAGAGWRMRRQAVL